MTISHNWLTKYINCNLDTNKIAEILTAIGLEVEGFEQKQAIKGGLEGLITAKVLECEKHPDADKLNVTTVDTGSELLQVVCGAPNVHKGATVILATVGATLYPNGTDEGAFKIKKSKIRGVESLGMLCAEDEIGVGNSHDGIILLPENTPIGVPAAQVFKLENDTIYEIGLTPNRIDGASHYGVARDLAAYLKSNGHDTNAVLPTCDKINKTSDLPVQIVVENSDAAPRYMGITLTDVKVKPSPEWLQTHLRNVGINPKNNVVDITNFILHECGQPLHAFDIKEVKGNKVVVRNANEGEVFTTLDGVERKLNVEDLLICNESAPMCIAGVLGGEKSGVSETTTEVFIESAYFNSVSVRKTAKRHAISTDASFRYERGTDPDMTVFALNRAVQLIVELADAKVASEIIDIYPNPVKPFNVTASLKRINSLIGKQLAEETVVNILTALDIKVVENNAGILSLEVPAYRVDVQREADIVEEVLRIYGLNNVENPSDVKTSVTYGNPKTTDKLVTVISNLLADRGLNEIMSNSLTKATYYEALNAYPQEKCVKILNPLSSDLDVMRQTLAFNMIEAIELNVNRRRSDLKLFEFGNCYEFKKPDAEGLHKYNETQKLAISMTGDVSQASWNNTATKADFFGVKSTIEVIFSRLGLNLFEGTWQTSDNNLYNYSYTYTMRGNVLFEIGEIAKKTREKLGVKQPIFYADINIAGLQKLVDSVRVSVKELSKFQPVKRDLALLVDSSVTFGDLKTTANKAEKKLLKNVAIFDVYEGDKLPEGKKSYALSFILSDDKTLTDKEIEKAMANISGALAHHNKAEVRS